MKELLHEVIFINILAISIYTLENIKITLYTTYVLGLKGKHYTMKYWAIDLSLKLEKYFSDQSDVYESDDIILNTSLNKTYSFSDNFGNNHSNTQHEQHSKQWVSYPRRNPTV